MVQGFRLGQGFFRTLEARVPFPYLVLSVSSYQLSTKYIKNHRV